MQTKLLEWIDEEAPKRGLYNDRMICKAAGLTPSVLSKARSGYQPIGWEACLKIADAFSVPQQVTLVLGGHIDPPKNNWSHETEELLSLFANMDAKDREEIMLLIRHKAKQA